MSAIRPPLLRPGATVRVIAPASPLPSRQSFFAGLAWLAARYRVRARASLLARHGYLAGDDPRRLEELQSALDEPDSQAVILARGGYGITRLLERLDWSEFRRAPKWLVGFSDGTALHAMASRAGVCSLHASNVNGLGSLVAADRAAWLCALEGGAARAWHVSGPPSIELAGPACGGNLSLLQALAAQGLLQSVDGGVCFVEDVTERPYRLDRMAISLRPWIRRAAAVVLGEFVGCEPAADGVTAEDALRSAWADLGVPVFTGAPFGHGARNAPIVLGAPVRIESDPTGAARVQLG